MLRNCFLRLALPLVAALSMTTGASAAVYCAVNGADLQNKLNAAAASADDDVIRLRLGGFVPGDGSDGFTYLSSNSGSLTLSGSWQGSQANPQACVSQYSENHTWFSPGSNQRALTISMTSQTPGAVTLEKLEFDGGTSALGGIGGCVSIVSQGEVALLRNAFYGCVAPLGDGGGLFLQSRSAHIVSNRMFSNAARRGAAMYVEARGGAFYINNNTMTANLAEGLAGASGGLHIVASGVDGADSVVYASNNIVWGNASGTDRYDIDISGLAAAAATLRYNHIGRVKGTPSGFSGETTSGDPLFVDVADDNFELRPNSPARNNGNSMAAGGVGSFDVHGQKRVQGSAIDRGAHEVDEMFGSSFE